MDEYEEAFDVVPLLTCLSQLRSLELQGPLSEREKSIACCLGARSLVSLQLSDYWHGSEDSARLLTTQTALTQLRVAGQQLADMRHLKALRLDLLQSLHLGGLGVPDALQGLLAF
jgi:hypothetical protein